MTYEERSAAIGTLLLESILPRFTRPAHLDDATARRELADMVEDLNGAWPVVSDAEFGAMGARLAKQVRQTVDGRTWPTIPRLLKALEVIKSVNPQWAKRPPDGPRPCRFELNAKRLKAHEPVGGDYLYGRDAVELVRRKLVTESELEAYRIEQFDTLARTYGEERALATEAQLRADHAAAQANFGPADSGDDRFLRAKRAMARRVPPVFA